MSWTPKAEERLAVLAKAGKSNGQIREILFNEGHGTFSKNAISGKIHRMGLREKKDHMQTKAMESGYFRFCQWIEGDPRTDPRRCNKAVKALSSYCPDHHARAYVRA